MAKKRKSTRKPSSTSARSGKPALAVQATPAQLGQPVKAQKLSREDTMTALAIAVAIVLFLAAIYLYQQNAKPKVSQFGPAPAIVAIARG